LETKKQGQGIVLPWPFKALRFQLECLTLCFLP